MTNNEHKGADERPQLRLVIVTGLSGAGKSTALNTLEDLGFNCIDNLPTSLLIALANELSVGAGHPQQVAVGIDARSNPQSLRSVPTIIEQLTKDGFNCETLFLEADDDSLIKRFSETRRKHPLTHTANTLLKAIQLERTLLKPLAARADLRIDTRNLNVHQLRDKLRERFQRLGNKMLSLQFQSFGFKNGVPRDADFVFDVRCLPNPHWQAELKPLTGKDSPVIRFLEESEQVHQMRIDIADFLDNWIAAFETEGRVYLTVAIGCTGGQHRSVYMAEALAHHFDSGERNVTIRHRESA